MNIEKQTFYNHKLDQLDSIKAALDKNKTALKAGLRKKWYESDNATVQIALYKLIGTEQESDAINSQRVKQDINITEDAKKEAKTFIEMITESEK